MYHTISGGMLISPYQKTSQMNYPKKETRARVWGGESWLLVSMINYKLTMNIAKNKTVISGNVYIWWQGPWNSCKLWGRSLIISWPLVFAHFHYSAWMLNLFWCVIHPVASPWHPNLIMFSVAMGSPRQDTTLPLKKKKKHGLKLFCKAFLWFPVCILQNLRALFLKFNGICCRVKKGSLFSLPLSNKGNVKKKKKAFERSAHLYGCWSFSISVSRI